MLKEIPKDISIFQYVLESPNEQLVIENVKEQSKTRNLHKMSFAPNIQFYAGTPIITSRGFTVGTLYITEKVPGILNHSQKNGLRLLSDQITNIIETGFTQSTPLVPRNEENETDIIHSNYYSLATILFTDFVGFTNLTEQIQPGELIETLDEFF